MVVDNRTKREEEGEIGRKRKRLDSIVLVLLYFGLKSAYSPCFCQGNHVVANIL